MIYLRRSDDQGNVPLLAQTFPVAEHWVHRLVRCEVDFTHQRIRFYAMRRRDPHHPPLLREIPYHHPNKPFQGKPSAFNNAETLSRRCQTSVQLTLKLILSRFIIYREN